MNPMDEFEVLRASLATIPTIVTCAIGLEDIIAPEDYPAIRVVPERINVTKYGRRTAEVSIYVGAAVAESKGLPAVYTAMFLLEDQIITKVRAIPDSRYLETVTDEDRLAAFKWLVVRCELTVS